MQWYDARARVALRCVSLWLGVPWAKVGTLACLAERVRHVLRHEAAHSLLHP